MFSQQTINKESKKLVALHYCCENINNIDCASHLGHVERHLHVTHCTKIVNFIRFDVSNNGDEVRRVTKIAVMKEKLHSGIMTVTVDVINTTCVEGRTTTDDAMNLLE